MTSPARVLVVDDVEANRDLLARRVARQGHDVVMAENGRVALERLRSKPFDLVLLDIMMPEMDGYEVLDAIKSDPTLSDTRVIMISAVTEMESIVRCLKAGADDYLSKPFQSALLKARLESSLARKAVKDALRQTTARLERELEIGRRIQAGFLPSELPQVSGWDLAAAFHPAREVAGDFYDAFTLHGSDRSTFLVVGDVCDKGVGAALFMALFRSLIRASAGGSSPDSESLGAAELLRQTARRTNDYIALTHSEANMFATLFMAVLEPEEGLFHYLNAGHEPALVIQPGGSVDRLEPTGPAAGLMAGLDFRVDCRQLAPGELVLVYTDGVTEARSESRELFGEDRLVKSVSAEGATGARSLVDALVAATAEHTGTAEPADDITMLVLRRQPDAD